MVPTPRSYTSGSSRLKPTLEILPDTRFIVFHGSEHEASSIKLTGRVRLTTPDGMSISRPKVRLEGKRKISWWFVGGVCAGEVTDKRVFWNQEQKLGIESTHKVKAGSIEWPFEFELSPSMPESVEGLRETFIVYHLHASVSRPGWNTKDLLAQLHIRIVRTLGQDSMEMTRSRVNSDIWANKISYSISIPSDAVVFGTSITADVELSPLRKGIILGKIELRLLETVVKRIQTGEAPDTRGDKSKSEETEVAKTDMEFPEHSKQIYYDETGENPTMEDEKYKFKATLPLPKSLNICRQDVDSHQIKVTHRFKLMINIHNPEGHISQLVCRLPVKLFISPNLPVDESNEVCAGANGHISHEQLNNAEATVTAPPEYGRHQLDQIFSHIDPSGYMSRAGSGPGTPPGLYSQSRRGSQENMALLNGIGGGDSGASSSHHGSATPALLHSRLADLQERGRLSLASRTPGVASAHRTPSTGNTPANSILDDSEHNTTPPVRSSSSLGAAGHSPNTIAPSSRWVSDEGTSAEVLREDYDLNDLSRVPSYGAALRTLGAMAPFTEGPPSYIEATSRPPSPGIQRPGQVHVRNGTSTPNSQRSQQTLTTPPSRLSMSAHHPPLSHRTSVADDEARLSILRART